MPQWVRRIVLKGLSAAPKDRFDSLDALIAALGNDPRKARNARLALAGTAVAVLGLVLGVVSYARGQSTRCRGAEDRLAGAWDREREQAIHAAFIATGAPYAEDAWRQVKASLDRYAAHWATQRTEACEATWLRGEQSEAVLSLRMRCLERRLDELRALTQTLGSVDPATMPRVTTPTSTLGVLSRCADVGALERIAPPPQNDNARKQLEPLEHGLHEAQALMGAGRPLEALVKLEKVSAAAKTLDSPALEAEAHLWLAKVRAELGQFDGLRPMVLETIRSAEQSADDATRFQALLLLAVLGTETGQSYDELVASCRLAESALGRIQDHGWYRVQLYLTSGNAARKRHRPQDALAAYARGLEATAGAEQDASWASRTIFITSLAELSAQQGQWPQALETLAQATRAITEHLGPQHPALAAHLLNVGRAELALGRSEAALATFSGSLDLGLRTVGVADVATLSAFAGKADALRALGHREEAERLLREAMVHAEKASPRPTALAELLLVLGRTSNELGRPAEAEKQLGAAITLLEGERAASDAQLVDARFELAQLVWATPKRQREARALAEKALGALNGVGGHTERIGRIQVWLKTHSAP